MQTFRLQSSDDLGQRAGAAILDPSLNSNSDLIPINELLVSKADQIGHQLIGAVGAGRQLRATGRGPTYTQRPLPYCASTARRASRLCCTGNGSSSCTQIAIARILVSPRKYRPRSWTQSFHAASVISFGVVNTGSCGTITFTGAFSSVTRFGAHLRRIRPYCASLNSNLLYWTISVPPLLHVVEQAAVVRAQIDAPLVGAHAGDDRREAREVAPGEIVGGDQLDLRAELLDRRRHVIADAHDVADGQVRRAS